MSFWLVRQEERRNLDGTDSKPVQFKIEARPQAYTFSFKATAPDAPWIDLGELSTRVLVDQKLRDALFTGTHFGLYAQGHEGTSCSQPASFSFACFCPELDEVD
jgi:beta-xylosidase